MSHTLNSQAVNLQVTNGFLQHSNLKSYMGQTAAKVCVNHSLKICRPALIRQETLVLL